RTVVQSISIPVHVLIRPRGGDFLYSGEELLVMLEDIATAKQAGAKGVVVGMLREDGTLNQEQLQAVISAAKPSLSITFHRAVDVSRDAKEHLKEIMQINDEFAKQNNGENAVDRILTSGHKNSAVEGGEQIRAMVELAKAQGSNLIIMPAAGINAENVASILE